MHRKSSPLSWRLSKERFKLAGSSVNGTIESFTVIYNAPQGFEGKIPYVLALINLENGEKVVSQVVDSEKVEIGMNVEPCLRKIYADGTDGIINYGTKFKVIR